METPPCDARGTAPSPVTPLSRRNDPDYTRSVLGISALIEATDETPRTPNPEGIVQHKNQKDTRECSDGTTASQIQATTTHESFESQHRPQKDRMSIKSFMVEEAIKEKAIDASHIPHITPSLVHADTTHDDGKGQEKHLALIADTESKMPNESGSSRDSAAAASTDISIPSFATEHRSQEHCQPQNQQLKVNEACESSFGSMQGWQPRHADSPSHFGHGQQSLLTSPLTHPNGMSMFPNLSTPEQEQLAQEALSQAEASIVADNGAESIFDSDGGYESDEVSSGSTSAASSVRDYMYENGRRYHRFREGHYNFPNDDVEQEREDMKHAMVKLLCSQKLHFAPVGSNPQEVLDIGTGTGIWAIEMGDQFPSAHVLGVDLSPIQPDWLPPNVRFMVDDAESPWLYPRNHFDYIHSRHTVMAIKDWDRLYRRAYEHLKPGAWMEMQEIHHRPQSANADGVVPPEHPVARFWTLVTQGLGALGVNLDISSGGILASKMQDAGLINVTERIFHVPIGTWPKNKVLKTVGLYWRTILLDGLQAIALGPLTRGLRWNRDQVELLLMEVRRGYHDNSALMYMPLHIIYAQKPPTAF